MAGGSPQTPLLRRYLDYSACSNWSFGRKVDHLLPATFEIAKFEPYGGATVSHLLQQA